MDPSLESQAASGREERSVKIDAYRQEIPTQATDRVGRPTTPVSNRDGGAAPASGNDEVRLSSGAQLMQSVMQSAQDKLEIRQDVVERMRAALANGTVGNDPHALAEALIDRLSGTPSDK